MATILAVDPGRYKCGIAVSTSERVLHKAIVMRKNAAIFICGIIAEYGVDSVILGDGTGSASLSQELAEAGCCIPIGFIDEKYSSQAARLRFLQENPPSGFGRLVPIGLRVPSRPYDDYVAVILAENYFKLHG